jgi:hypothetical protein
VKIVAKESVKIGYKTASWTIYESGSATFQLAMTETGEVVMFRSREWSLPVLAWDWIRAMIMAEGKASLGE